MTRRSALLTWSGVIRAAAALEQSVNAEAAKAHSRCL